MAGPLAVGYFNVANTIRNAAQGLLTPFTQSIYPRINAVFDSDYSQAIKIIKNRYAMLEG